MPLKKARPSPNDLFAAVDLGSNSFHMVVGRLSRGELRILDRQRDQVQLGAGLGRDLKLSSEAQKRGLASLRRFGQSLAHLPIRRVRAVGTNTLRVARNASSFLERARVALGHPIEIVSGREEARLIHLGVAHSLADGSGRRLVVDIGGGSTEIIIGERFEPLEAESLYMGCVSFTRDHFPKGILAREAFRRAEIAARALLQPIERRYRTLGWDGAVGASGTIVAIAEILRASGFGSGEGIDEAGLRRLRKAMVAAGSVRRLSLAGLRPDRAPILAAGVAILSAVFEGLELDRMTVSTGALREGLLHDLLGRDRHDDVRDRTIRILGERFVLDRAQGARVERTALAIFDGVAEKWKLDPSADRQILAWAARLHEAGIAISHSGYHKHGAYLLAYADLPGFSKDDQILLAALVRTHRRRVSADPFPELPPAARDAAMRLAVVLRVAVVLHRSRSPKVLPPLGVLAKKHSLRIELPAEWLALHPLTANDLEGEALELEAAGFGLSFS